MNHVFNLFFNQEIFHTTIRPPNDLDNFIINLLINQWYTTAGNLCLTSHLKSTRVAAALFVCERGAAGKFNYFLTV